MTDKVADNTLSLTVDFSNYIEYRFWEGKHPHIKGRRVRVSWIAGYIRDNDNYGIRELATDLKIPEIQVAAALLYYEAHKEKIDALEDAEYQEYSHLHED